MFLRTDEGWAKIGKAKKFHFFVEGMSLCRSWAIHNGTLLWQGSDDHPENCQECQRRRLSRRLSAALLHRNERQGWALANGHPLWHYFRNEKAICGSGVAGILPLYSSPGGDGWPACGRCQRKLQGEVKR